MIHNWSEFNIAGFTVLSFYFLESTYRHQGNIDDEVVTMEILDTAGQVRLTKY